MVQIESGRGGYNSERPKGEWFRYQSSNVFRIPFCPSTSASFWPSNPACHVRQQAGLAVGVGNECNVAGLKPESGSNGKHGHIVEIADVEIFVLSAHANAPQIEGGT